jgi:NAD(P)-dependent dehydrogenase (short-subunit alcohol dehydrogenase family)
MGSRAGQNVFTSFQIIQVNYSQSSETMAAPFPSPTSTWHSNTYQSLSPTRPELSAKGKTVLITGGGSGIGAETAAYFAEAGASQIALLGRREQPLVDTKASLEQRFPQLEVFIASTDVTNKRQVDAAFESFLGDGKLHVLVSNAAITGPHDGVEDVESEAFMESIDQNLKGSLLVAQAFLRYASPDAVVIETNSFAAHLTFGPKFAAYSIAKFAVYRLWDFLAEEKPNLSIFHVQPGVVDTAMSKEAGGVAALGIEDHSKYNGAYYKV